MFAKQTIGQHFNIYGALLSYELLALLPGLVYTVTYEVSWANDYICAGAEAAGCSGKERFTQPKFGDGGNRLSNGSAE